MIDSFKTPLVVTGRVLLALMFILAGFSKLGNLEGTVAAAVFLAVLEGLITSFTDPTVARIFSLAIMSGVLLFRPHGLFSGAKR